MSSLSKKIIEIFKTQKNPEKVIEQELITLLNKDPSNSDLWLRLAILKSDSPFIDFEGSFACIDYVLKLEPNNYKALLLFSEIEMVAYGISQETVDKLNNFKFPTVESASMAQYQISKKYKLEDKFLKIKALEQSVQLYQGHVHNNFRLGEYYYEQNRTKEALLLFEQALNNVIKSNEALNEIDFTDVDRYIAEFISGTETSHVDRIEQAILKCKETWYHKLLNIFKIR